jgi:hypothetical protein
MKTEYFNIRGLSKLVNIRYHSLCVHASLGRFPKEVEEKILAKLTRWPDIEMVRELPDCFNHSAIGRELGIYAIHELYRKPYFEGKEEEVNQLFKN